MLRTRFAPIHPEFSAFLFAPIFEEENGMLLSVISGLTRLGYDPWHEAARLRDAGRAAALDDIAATVVTLAAGRRDSSETRTIAARLADLLPRRASALAPVIKVAARRKMTLGTSVWLAGLLAAALVVGIASVRVALDAHPAKQDESTQPRISTE